MIQNKQYAQKSLGLQYTIPIIIDINIAYETSYKIHNLGEGVVALAIPFIGTKYNRISQLSGLVYNVCVCLCNHQTFQILNETTFDRSCKKSVACYYFIFIFIKSLPWPNRLVG